MRIAEHVTVRASAKEVWDVVTDPSQAANVMAGVTRWDVAGDADRGEGARYRVLMQVGSAPVGGLVEVVEYDPCREMAWTSVTGVDQRGRWRLRPTDDGGTSVELRLSYAAPGGLIGLLADRFSAPMVRRNLRETLERLRERVDQ
jgi:uncharacterized membrane protein